MKYLIAVCILILMPVVPGFAQSNSKDEPVRTIISEFVDAQISFNAAALDRLLSSDYIEISPLGEFDPREKVLGFYKPELKPALMPAVEVSDVSIRNYGKFAIVIAKLTYKVNTGGAAIPPRSMRGTFVCRKEKGGWKIASSQYTGIRPTQPPKN